MQKIDNYPNELIENREMIEANFIFCLWKNPELFYDYEKEVRADRDLMTEDGIFYYSLGYEMFVKGYKSFDDASIYSYIEDKEVIKNGFTRRGGYKTVDDIKKILNEENIDTYYDELVKNNMLLKLNDKGFNVINELAKFKKMSSTQLYNYFEYQLDNIFLSRGAGVKIEDLDIDDDFIEACDAGEEMGLSYASACPLLNFHTLGLHKSNVQIFAGFSGTGKTSFCISSYIMPILDQGESIVIVANEMNKRAWQHILMATILSQKLGYYGLGRKKQKMGGLSVEQKQKMKEAKEYYNTHYKGRLKFAKIYDYSVEDVKKVIRKMAKQGFGYALYDTFKAEDAASATVTGELIEASKQLLQVAEKENIGIIITMQLAIYMENTRYLSSACLSNAKGVKEIVSELVLTRPLWDDEFNGQKFDVHPYRFKKDSTGKFTKIKEEIQLNPDKKYRLVFLDKTRNDEGETVLLYQFDGAWNKWIELGYCTPKHQRA
ncbi:DnaB-like helicase C-terminal domain-containing protein [Priestia flexa]|uniref:DnaB-like helicase C-terminal domain-containing protein n=1 Tax=Priestia flexa TaxID=86664 RepID=UPI000473EE46|nr:DnaB-like helicase C-terminal domain-containing protein [Priestia flexa]